MKKFQFCLFFTLSLFFSFQLSAQMQCGTSQASLDDISMQIDVVRSEMAGFVSSRDVIYVPVRFHLVANSAGEGRVKELNALSALCVLNENYANQEINFYLKEFNYINNSGLYTNPQGFSGGLTISNNMEYDALNIFVVEHIASDPNGSFTAGYYQHPWGPNGNDWIVVLKTRLTDETLTHEIGHFFQLLHPFNGWDHEPWDPAVHGNPVSSLIAPDGQTLVEFASGSNCMNAGDKVCDTPANYNFGLTYSNGCNYIGNAMDPNEQLVSPIEENFMDYFQSCSSNHFSDDQKELIQMNLNHFNRNYLESNYVPNTTELSDDLNIISPANAETVSGYNYVALEWEPVSGADHYVVEIIGDPNISIVVDNPYAVFQDVFGPDELYFWRVKAWNDGYTCANATGSRFFRTPDNTVNISEVKAIQNWNVIPNPVSNQDEITVLVDAKNNFTANVSLINITGKAVKNISNYQFANSQNSLQISVNDLPAGIYNLVIQNGNEVSNQKIVITN